MRLNHTWQKKKNMGLNQLENGLYILVTGEDEKKQLKIYKNTIVVSIESAS